MLVLDGILEYRKEILNRFFYSTTVLLEYNRATLFNNHEQMKKG